MMRSKLLLPVILAGVLVVTSAALVSDPGPAAADAGFGSGYTSITPTRILDTRTGIGAPTGAVKAQSVVRLHVVQGLVPAGVTAVVLNVTVTAPTAASGYVTVWADGASTPSTSSLNFVRGQTVPNLVVAPVSSGGYVALLNGSIGTTQLIADISGYFVGAAPNSQGSFGSIPPVRALDTRNSAAVGAGKTVAFTATRGSVPADASAAVVNLTVTGPSAATGDIAAYPQGGSVPSSSNLNFVRGQTVANLAVVPIGAGGEIVLYNHSAGSVQLIADISGYFLGGDPVSTGTFGALTPTRLLDTRNGTGAAKAVVGPQRTLTLTVAGRGGVPLKSVAAVMLNVTVTQPSGANGGYLTVYGDGPRPVVSNLNFARSQTVPNFVFAPVSSSGTVSIFNGSTGTVQIIADVSGYVLKSAAPLPSVVSTSRYVRKITGGSGDVSTMQAEGAADAASGFKFVVLHIGAQLNNQDGVQLSSTATNLTYDQLVTALQAYLTGYGANSGATVAIATSNDAADWTSYPALLRGQHWATKVVNKLSVPTGVAVVGASDIEASFGTKKVSDALGWETAYLGAATTKKLIFTGSADGCPSAYGANGACNSQWTQANYYALAGGTNPTQIQALPQIYNQAQAVQWANIDRVGGLKIVFAGALTEYAACPTATSPGCTFAVLPARQGWAALWHALSTVIAAPSLPVVTDLRVDS